MNVTSIILLLALTLASAATAQQPAQPARHAATGAANAVTDAEYAAISQRILDRVVALKRTQPTLERLQSPTYHEHNVTWVLDDPSRPHGKLNARRAVYGPGGYWFSLQFYRGQWGGAAVFSPIEFGDLKLWFDYGHGGDASVIAAVNAVVKEELEAFRKVHPGLTGS